MRNLIFAVEVNRASSFTTLPHIPVNPYALSWRNVNLIIEEYVYTHPPPESVVRNEVIEIKVEIIKQVEKRANLTYKTTEKKKSHLVSRSGGLVCGFCVVTWWRV